MTDVELFVLLLIIGSIIITFLLGMWIFLYASIVEAYYAIKLWYMKKRRNKHK